MVICWFIEGKKINDLINQKKSKNMKTIAIKNLLIFFLGLFMMTCGKSDKNQGAIIPKPNSVINSTGTFTLTTRTAIVTDGNVPGLEHCGAYLSSWLEKVIGDDGEDGAENFIFLSLLNDDEASFGGEGYQIEVKSNEVKIRASHPAGIFYAIQTFRQLFPPGIEKDTDAHKKNLTIPCLDIKDKPRFNWRGMLLDCGRHFMSKRMVKRYLDLLAYYKMNRLHWHLTEDQGWRIEIRKYPRLTEIGAWRTYEDGTRYGGYYTQQDIKEIVEYAQKRFITIVPEIELPGHSVAALASYPHLSCTGGPFTVETQWGVHKDVYCAGNDETFKFLENVLTEVLALFPSKYIHIGGDECPKDRWQNCSKCQRRIKSENLKDEHELQSYFIRRIETFLNKNDRQLIGWDEILEGGLAPGATVQSWRGMEGAVEAARAGHDAIVSPTSHAYFDYDIATTDLRQVYSFDPVPAELNDEERRHIIGGECNVWTERITEDNLDQMVFPRLLAMSEVLWSQGEKKDYTEFLQRARNHYQRLDNMGVKYGAESKPVGIKTSFNADDLTYLVTMETGEPLLELYYTLDGEVPDLKSTKYSKQILVDKSCELNVSAFRNGEKYGEIEKRSFNFHITSGKNVELKSTYAEHYSGGGEFGLTNGIRGSINFRDGYWQGYEENDFDAVLDLEEMVHIKSISVGFIQNTNSWIFLPRKVEFAFSADGEKYQVLDVQNPDISMKNTDALIQDFVLKADGIEARFIRIRAENLGVCPEWHPGAGGKAWLFVDEIVVE